MNPQTNLQKNVTDIILSKIQDLTESNLLVLPSDYVAANALKAAWIILQNTIDKDKKPVLNSCSPESIQMAVYDMVVQGLNPMKRQCYFIAYGNKLTCQKSYFGSIALAKRFGKLKSIKANVIYQADKFIYDINKETGLTHVVEHAQLLENIDLEKIKGAYATCIFEDGITDVVIMTKPQINKAWGMGFGETKTHKDFTDEMCKKTVINRACKIITNSSDDSVLIYQQDIDNNDEVANEIKQKEAIDISYEEMKPESQQPVKKEAPLDTKVPVAEKVPVAPVQNSAAKEDKPNF